MRFPHLSRRVWCCRSSLTIRNRQDFTVKLLDQQGDHEVGVGVFFRENDKDSAFGGAELLSIDGSIEAQDLLQLRVQERIQPGHSGGHDGLHCLFGGVQGGASEPPGFVIGRKPFHKELELVLTTNSGGAEQVLNQLEHGDDVPLLRLGEFRNQQNGGSHQTLGRIVEECVLTERGSVAVAVDQGLGDDLGILFSLGFVGQFATVLTEFVATDEWLESRGVEPGTSYRDYLLSFAENTLAYDREFHFEQMEKARSVDSGSAELAASHINDRASGGIVPQAKPAVKPKSAEEVGVDIDSGTGSVSPKVMNSERTWAESDYVQEREKAAQEIAKAIGVSVKKAKAYIDSVNSILLKGVANETGA